MEQRRFLVILTIVLIVLLCAVVWFFPSDEDFRTENPFWNGTRDISFSHPASPLPSLFELPFSPQGSTLILIPYLGFTSAEMETLNNFVTKGGTLILADDYGYGNQVLEYLGLESRFSRQTLLDPLVNYKNKSFPTIFRLKADSLTANIKSLVFNHATCLVNVESDDALALSSRFSFLDLNGNQTQDGDEPAGPLPVISQYDVGNGHVVLISDPSIFINSMEEMEGNNTFIENIAAATTKSLLIDQSHLPSSDLHQTKNILAKIRSFLTTPPVAIGLVILVLIITMRPVWHKPDDKPLLKGDNNNYEAG